MEYLAISIVLANTVVLFFFMAKLLNWYSIIAQNQIHTFDMMKVIKNKLTAMHPSKSEVFAMELDDQVKKMMGE